MKIALINGSPGAEKSVSYKMLFALEKRLGNDIEFVRILSITGGVGISAEELRGCDAVVFAFPVYMGAIPSQLLSFLRHIETLRIGEVSGSSPKKVPAVYAVVGCGFIEGDNTKTAMDMLRIWSGRAGCEYRMSVGFGGGGIGRKLASGKGAGRKIGRALDSLARDILTKEVGEDIITKAGKPRWLYNLSGNRRWVSAAKKRGLKKKDMELFYGNDVADGN